MTMAHKHCTSAYAEQHPKYIRELCLCLQDDGDYDVPDRLGFEERKRLQQAQQDQLQFPDEVLLPSCIKSAPCGPSLPVSICRRHHAGP